MKKMSFSLGWIFVALLFVGCSANRHASNLAPVESNAIVDEYKIGLGDTLTINVWRNVDLTRAVLVRPDGKITLPLIGDVLAAGETAEALSEKLRSSLSNYIRNPQVTVIVDATDSTDYEQRVRITGSVTNPLSIVYREGMTVLDIVLEAQGLNEFARANQSTLYRKNTEGGVSAYKVKLGDILFKGKLSTNYDLRPGDIITVPERTF